MRLSLSQTIFLRSTNEEYTLTDGWTNGQPHIHTHTHTPTLSIGENATQCIAPDNISLTCSSWRLRIPCSSYGERRTSWSNHLTADVNYSGSKPDACWILNTDPLTTDGSLTLKDGDGVEIHSHYNFVWRVRPAWTVACTIKLWEWLTVRTISVW